MKNKEPKITLIGAGVIGTALGNVLAAKPSLRVTLHSIEQETTDDISNHHVNKRYFPTLRLNDRLIATSDNKVLEDSDLIFLAIPSVVVVEYLESIREYIRPETHLVNLAKGFGCGNKTVCQCVEARFPNPISTLKGPSFAREIISRTR